LLPHIILVDSFPMFRLQQTTPPVKSNPIGNEHEHIKNTNNGCSLI
jgi:hypothetical protein